MELDGYNIIFTDFDKIKCAGDKWYRSVMNMYKNILKFHGFKVETKDFGYNEPLVIENIDYIDNAIKEKSSNDIYIFNPLDFATLLLNLHKYNESIFALLNNIKYIVFWQEILKDDLNIVGYNDDCIYKKFVFDFFNNSLLNVVSNEQSINSLEKNNITKNKYYMITGYCQINNIVPFPSNESKNIDVLIYGTMHQTYDHRRNAISELLELNKAKYQYNIMVSHDLYGDALDDALQQTKIVVHISSHPNLNHMPWPKITYLQARKVFFIIEDNDELRNKKLKNIVSYNKISRLYSKIKYYLNNPDVRESIILKNYNYIVDNSNMDIIVPDIIKSVM